MYFSLFLTAFAVALSGALMPGPMLTVCIHQSYRRGIGAGPVMVAGHGLLELAVVLGLTTGLGALLVAPLFQGVIAVLGGIVMLRMGWGMVRDARTASISLLPSARSGSQGLHPLIAGVIVSFGNPYWILWWATIGLTYLTVALKQGTAALAVFLTGHLLADLFWYSGISLAVVSGKRIISEKYYRVVIMVCGIFLAGLAVYFIVSGIKSLTGS